MVPQPIAPTVMRSEGAGRPGFPNTEEGTIAGKPSAAALEARKRRREKCGTRRSMVRGIKSEGRVIAVPQVWRKGQKTFLETLRRRKQRAETFHPQP
jgi:hypothetical protein